VKILVTNKTAFHDFHILESLEAGIALAGTEVKSLRAAKCNLSDGWVDFSNDEAILRDVAISPYSHGNQFNHGEKRPRRLLLHRQQIAKFAKKIETGGLTVVPTKVYLKDNLIKVEIAKGKKEFDRREDIKKRSANRDIARALRSRNKG
jgi:SsrA-binding protein